MTNREKLALYKLEISTLPEEDGGGFQALYPQLARTVVGYGETQIEALNDLQSGVDMLLESLEDDREALPEAEQRPAWSDFSGRVTLRITKSLHFRLNRLADEEGVSLNSLLSDMLQSGATALESGLVFGAVMYEGSIADQVCHELADMRKALDGLAIQQTWSSQSEQAPKMLNPISYRDDLDFSFIRLAS